MWVKQCHVWHPFGMVTTPHRQKNGDDWGDGAHGIILPTLSPVLK